MKPAPLDWDVLIHHHLEGLLTAEEGRALGQALRIDSRLRRRLAEMAYDQVVLGELAAGERLPQATRETLAAPLLKPAPRKPRRRKKK